ncbi:MAG: hypothetical protein DA405_13645 [Bacteroidetes bacterium]|nr:MAG: hypothetical protein DA405_13645 [Bacteroidota bacterium]
MCGAGNGASSGGKSGGNNNNKTKKVVKPVNNADYQTRAKANKSTNIPVLKYAIKDKYRNNDVSYNQAYWATQRASGVSQADMKAEQDSIGMKKAYSGDRVPTSFPNTGPPSQFFKEGTASVNDVAPRKKIALTIGASAGGGSGGSNQDTALAGGGTAGRTGDVNNQKNMLATNRKVKAKGKKATRNLAGLAYSSKGTGLNIST